MKPYFAKYLAIDGEIRPGDKSIKDGVTYHHHNVSFYGIEKGHQKIKLFLCSRDIQVGDNYQSPKRFGSKEYIDAYCDGDFFPGSFKVFGEISTEATWVKEGDEFDESQVRRWTSSIDNHTNPFFKIKGPCGHFH